MTVSTGGGAGLLTALEPVEEVEDVEVWVEVCGWDGGAAGGDFGKLQSLKGSADTDVSRVASAVPVSAAVWILKSSTMLWNASAADWPRVSRQTSSSKNCWMVPVFSRDKVFWNTLGTVRRKYSMILRLFRRSSVDTVLRVFWTTCWKPNSWRLERSTVKSVKMIAWLHTQLQE